MPQTINITGSVLDASGAVVSGTRAWQLQFYDAAVGGATLGAALTGTATLSGSGELKPSHCSAGRVARCG